MVRDYSMIGDHRSTIIGLVDRMFMLSFFSSKKFGTNCQNFIRE